MSRVRCSYWQSIQKVSVKAQPVVYLGDQQSQILFQLWNGFLFWLNTRWGIGLLLGAMPAMQKRSGFKKGIHTVGGELPLLWGIWEPRTQEERADSHLLFHTHSSGFVQCLGCLWNCCQRSHWFPLLLFSILSHIPVECIQVRRNNPSILECSHIHRVSHWELGILHCLSRPIE